MLTDIAVRNTKAADKPYKLSDERGLYLHVMLNGGRYWRMNYRHMGKQKTLALGIYPDVTLKDARERRDVARRLLADGVDPGAAKAAQKASNVAAAANSFEAIAREWFARVGLAWVPSHADKILRRLERDVFPWIGKKPIAEIKAPEVLQTVRRIENRGAVETAHRALQNIGQIFRYATATGRTDADPTGALRGALKPYRSEHFAAVTETPGVGALVQAIDGYQGGLITKCALRLAPLVFVRPGELRHAQWVDIDLEGAEWRFVVSKTKTEHIVPLSRQAVEILGELQPVTGGGRYLFPSVRTKDRPMSENTVNAALKRLGYGSDEMTGHGFRAMARTVLDEVLGFRPDFIEHQLAHAVRDPLGRAYNRTTHLKERREMMQVWGDYLDALKAGGNVLPFRKTA